MLPPKYTNLQTANKLGCRVPPMLLLNTDALETGTYQQSLTHFIQENLTNHYIIRSAVSIEDTSATSHAGEFFSSGAITASELPAQIEKYYAKNRSQALQHTLPGDVHLLLMPFIEAERGGVVFTPWHYFYQHSLVTEAASPQQAVAGTDTRTYLLSHESPSNHWQKELVTYLETLHAHFRHPIDVEWAVYEGVVYILQVRPTTRLPLGITAHIEDVDTSPKLEFTPYAEAFGKLSPASFSFYQTLYENAHKWHDRLGVVGRPFFLSRTPSGQLCEDAEKRRAYFTNTRWWSAFTRSYQTTHFLHQQTIPETNVPAVFDWQKTLVYFTNWQLCQYASKTIAEALPHEYELTWPLDPERYTKKNASTQWKKVFMQSIAPLRTTLLNQPTLVWGEFNTTINTFEASIGDSTQTELLASLEYLTPTPSQTAEIIRGPISGEICFISNPELRTQSLPTQKIIVTPYIPLAWVRELHQVKGVVVSHLSPLSHIDITLREQEIPTAVVPQTELEVYRTQSFISLS